MKIICGHCGRVMTIKQFPHHYVCSCKKVLIWFGEQKDCIIIESRKPYIKKIVSDFLKRDPKYMSLDEKTRFFEEKYPLKQ